MSKLLIKLTPLEPYFLGGERIFEKGDGNKHYFIRSMDTPSQTTLFGVLRYICLKNPAARESRPGGVIGIGKTGYRIDSPSEEGFGKIRGISPLYLLDKSGAYWMPVPFDHVVSCDCSKELLQVYTRFEDYSDPIQTVRGKRRFPEKYNGKNGVTNGWLCIENRRVRSDLFTGITQIGINRKNTDKALFKKEYKRLENGFCFAFFADVAEDFSTPQRVAYLGQSKSPFGVEVSPDAVEPEIPNDLLRPGIAYAQSDIYYTGDIQTLYNSCQFICTQTRDYKIFAESYLNRNKDRDRVVKLIRAGSVFWPNDPATFRAAIQNDHAAIAGFNKIFIGGDA